LRQVRWTSLSSPLFNQRMGSSPKMPLKQVIVNPIAEQRNQSADIETGSISEIKDNSSIKSEKICRICHCGVEDEEFISPCKCTGSLGFIHQTCLQSWLNISGKSNKKQCELCHYDFKLQSTLKPFHKWKMLKLTPYERKKVICSIAFHLLAVLCVIWSIWVLMERLITEANQNDIGWAFWTKIGVVFIGFVGGISFMYSQCKMYVTYFNRWKASNQVIVVLDMNHESPIPDPQSTKQVDICNQEQAQIAEVG